MLKGRIIRELREKNQMTQEQLASKLSTSKQTIFKYENDIVTNIPSDKVEMMAKIFNVSPAYIMGWEDMSQTDFLVKTKDYDLVIERMTRTPQSKKQFELLCYYFSVLNIEGQKALGDYATFLAGLEKYSVDTNRTNNITVLSYSINEAAHERTDIEVTEDMRKHDDDIMDGDDF